MDLSIIIVSWNVKEKLRENLEALYGSEGDFNFEVIVVDNDSSDNTVEMIKRDFPQVKVMANEDNLGFSRANNQAIKIAQGDFLLLLNPDMRVEKSTLRKILEWMRENKQASLASCRLVNDRGEIIKHVRRFPKLADQLAIISKLPHLIPGILKKYIVDDFDYERAWQVDSVRGGFMMIRRETIEKVGLLDERYFIWFEEVDYCLRIKKADGEVWYTPAANCIDYVGQSFKQVKTPKKQLYFRDSMLKYFKKWHPVWQYWILWLAWWIGLSFSFFGTILKIKNSSKT